MQINICLQSAVRIATSRQYIYDKGQATDDKLVTLALMIW